MKHYASRGRDRLFHIAEHHKRGEQVSERREQPIDNPISKFKTFLPKKREPDSRKPSEYSGFLSHPLFFKAPFADL